jgi:hypothetical protein
MKKILILFIGLFISCSIFAQTGTTRDDRDLRQAVGSQPQLDTRQGDRDSRDKRDNNSSKRDGVTKAGLTECAGEFALCAASTCKPTGKTITVKENGGKTTKQYQESVCTCPIITKDLASQNNARLVGIAGLNEGNMDGSCRPPGAGKVWSYFSKDISTYPQEQINGSFSAPIKNGQPNSCPSSSSAQGSNCWSYLCTIDPKETNGTKTATCTCPYGEGVFGQKANKNRGYQTYAGNSWSDPSQACGMLPVGFPDQLLQ